MIGWVRSARTVATGGSGGRQVSWQTLLAWSIALLAASACHHHHHHTPLKSYVYQCVAFRRHLCVVYRRLLWPGVCVVLEILNCGDATGWSMKEQGAIRPTAKNVSKCTPLKGLNTRWNVQIRKRLINESCYIYVHLRFSLNSKSKGENVIVWNCKTLEEKIVGKPTRPSEKRETPFVIVPSLLWLGLNFTAGANQWVGESVSHRFISGTSCP